MAEDEKYVCTLSSALKKLAEDELNETDSNRDRDIQALREKVRGLPGLNSRTDGGFLVRFLRTRKYNVERAFQLVQSYYKARVDAPEFYDNFTPSSVRHVLDSGIVAVLRDRDKEGRRIVVFRIDKWNPVVITLAEIFKTGFLLMEKIIEEEETQVAGVVFIEDLAGMNANHVYYASSPTLMYKGYGAFQNAFPCRIKGGHYLNESPLFDGIFAIIKPILSEKIKSRIRMHGKVYDTLHECVGKHALPPEYGGDGPAYDDSVKHWTDILMASEQDFVKYNKKGFVTHGSLGTSATGDETMSGMAGSFKKLNVD
ncbi:PREDICTED: alpha-tocopherol transfer protein-like [Branchiostoma belcheri]|uniref:Alpha-tocopherol transfer protein-like n=1 Tax=Branchiostoma belcheri TaxID=7741 RepID=A0A6P5A2P5_BRABE|nr:PREDICTED: alpha-tocopherol transfer protein-like [Branchiostoma belcheri]XP_019637473.1 PREDICTED: alpha-tocopherol transfer protein-like [Branchiostoma belcheri]